MAEGARRARIATPWRTSILLALAMLVTLAGMHVVLAGALWYWGVAAVVVVLFGVSAGIRLLRWPAWLAPVGSFVVLLLILTAVFAPKTALFGILPTSRTLAGWNFLLSEANGSIDRQSLPANADIPIMFLLVLCVGLLCIAADFFANVTNTPAVVGVPIVVLLGAPGFVSRGSSDPLIFVGAVVAYLLILRIGSRRGQAGLSVGVGAIAVVLALLVPFVLPPVASEDGGAASGVGPVQVNPVLSLGKNLRANTQRDILTYSTSSGSAEYLRLIDINNFSGTSWAPDKLAADTANTVDAIGSPPGLGAGVARTRESTFVQVSLLATPWLPVPYPPSSISGLSGNWAWHEDGLTISSGDTTAQGQRYRVTSLTTDPTPAQLTAAGTSVPAGFDKFTKVPKGSPAIIATTARQVTAGASTSYEKALALQTWFRANFDYSEIAPVKNDYDGTGAAAVAAFLQAKSGYCIHFASAMALMARTLGIPSRVAVGFLPGIQIADQGGRTRHQVSTQDTHAWPELYFEGIGWTRFEPTASRGELPSYADPAVADVPVPVTGDTTADPSVTATPEPVATDPATTDATGGTDQGAAVNWAAFWWVLAVALLVLLLLVPAILRSLQRSRRIRALAGGAAPPSTAWGELLQSAEDLGGALPETNTPREVAALLAERGLAGRPELERLVTALETESYSRTPQAASYPGIDTDLLRLVAGLTAARPRKARVVAALLPPSLWRGLVGIVGG